MKEYSIGILGGLIGSLLAVFISKLLEILQKRKEHQYNLERIFFEKKLLAAEATITQYTILSNALTYLAILYERLNNEANEIEDNLQDGLFEQAMRQLEVANNASFIVANSITLYFDLKTQFDDNEIINDFYNLLGSIQPLQDNKNLAFEQHKSAIGTELEALAYQIYLESEKELNDLLKEISSSYIVFNNELYNVIGQIRNEMRKFEY